MKFEQLKNSLQLNEQEQPSIYLALCLVDSIFKDVKQESGGVPIENNPIGNEEMLPMMLARLFRTLEKVYSNNTDEMEQFKSMLEAKIASSEADRIELEKLAGFIQKSRDQEQKCRGLEKQLEEARQSKKQYEENVRTCSKLEAELEELRSCDDAGAVAERLTELRIQRDTLVSKNEKQKADLKELQDEIASQKTEQEQLSKVQEQIASQKEKLEKQIIVLEKKFQDLRNGISSEEMPLQLQGGQLVLGLTMEQRLQKIRKISGEIQAHITALQKKADTQTGNYDNLVTQKAELDGNIQNMTNQIAALNISIRELEKEKKSKQEQIKELEAEKGKISKGKKADEETVDQLNEDVREAKRLKEMQEQSIPQLEQALSDYKREKDECEKKSRKLQEQIDGLKAELTDLEQQLSERNDTIRSQKNSKKAMTESLAASDKEIKALDDELEKLRGQNDVERRNNMKSQLQRKIEELEGIQQECENLESDNKEKGEELQDAQKKRSELEKAKQSLENSRKEVDEILQRLGKETSAENCDALQQVKERLQLLKGVSRKLDDAVRILLETLNIPDQEAHDLKQSIEALSNRTDELQKALMESADMYASCMQKREEQQ